MRFSKIDLRYISLLIGSPNKNPVFSLRDLNGKLPVFICYNKVGTIHYYDVSVHCLVDLAKNLYNTFFVK